jgi:hypothetical protein
MWDEARNIGSRKTSSFTRRHAMKWNGTEGKKPLKGKKPKQFQGPNFKPKGNFVKKGVPFKVGPLKGDASGSPKEHVSIVKKWGVTPKIAPNPSRGMEVPR